MSKEEIAHDIAVSLLPKFMEEVGDKVGIRNNAGKFEINARNIQKHYRDIYSSVLVELSEQ